MEVKKGYKHTEVGVIPEDWESTPVGNLAMFTSGKGISVAALQRQSSNFHVPVFGGNGIAGYTATPLITSPSVVVGRVGQKCGEVYVTDGPAWVTDNALYPRHISRPLEVRFLALALEAARLNDVKNRNDLPLVTQSILHSVRVAWPSDIHEQRAIVGVLSDVDALIGSLDKLIAKKHDLKQAAMQQLLTGKQRLPGFTGEWEVKRLGDIGSFAKGKGIKKDEVVPEGLPCIRYGEIYTRHNDYLREFGSFISRETAKESQRIFKGDLLFAGSGETSEEIGKCVAYLRDDEAYAGGDIVIFTPLRQDSMYLGYLLNHPSVAIQKARMGQGDAVVHISARHLGQIELHLPPLPEQTAIATVLSDMDAEIAALEQRRDKTRLLKQGMMQELLTGRTRLVVPTVTPCEKSQEASAASTKPHNWAINEAVVISVLAKTFGTEKYPLGRKRYTKLSYLLHRHVERKAEGYLKKAAGPYNPSTRYGGPEKIAQQNRYIRSHGNGQYSGFVAADEITQAEGYFEKWYGADVLGWLEQFRYMKNDDLEVLATVDMAVQDLREAGVTVTLDAVKDVIRNHPEWEAKLNRSVFADANIRAAIVKSNALFG
jgi:type I restriction enzyme S subunit